MNNTSAYANVLLKTPVATPATVTPKRDYENDDASVDFQQTFKAAHDNQKAQDERVSKSANHKKSTQLERHSDTKNTKEIKEVKATNEAAAKQNPADNSTEVNRNAIDNELVREQPVQHKNKNIGANKATEGELDQDATNRVTDLNPDTLMTSAAVNEVGVGVIQSALVVDTALTTTTATSMPATVAVSVAAAEPMSMQEIPVATDIYAAPVPIDPATAISPEKPVAVTSVDVAAAPIAVNSIVPEVIDSRTPVSPLSVKSKSATALDVTTLVSTEPNSITLETEKLATVSPNPDASVKAEKSGEVISQPLINPLTPQRQQRLRCWRPVLWLQLRR
jgi:hypothetical protein